MPRPIGCRRGVLKLCGRQRRPTPPTAPPTLRRRDRRRACRWVRPAVRDKSWGRARTSNALASGPNVSRCTASASATIVYAIPHGARASTATTRGITRAIWRRRAARSCGATRRRFRPRSKSSTATDGTRADADALARDASSGIANAFARACSARRRAPASNVATARRPSPSFRIQEATRRDPPTRACSSLCWPTWDPCRTTTRLWRVPPRRPWRD